MTHTEFVKRFKALLREAEDAGLDMDVICELAESVLGTDWAPESDRSESDAG
jgi:hypothetical protein